MQYEVQVTREEGWWMIKIPALEGVTQARKREDVEREARDYIVVTEDVAPSQVEVIITSVVIDGVDYWPQLHAEREARREADALASRARQQQAEIATELSAAGVSMRDIAVMLDMSHQRVQQLIAMSSRESAAA